MPEDIFYYKDSDIPIVLPDIPQEVFTPIREGLIAGTLVEIEYDTSSDEDSKRQILPEVLFRSSENWYVAAYCMLRDEPRTFRLDRIISAENTGVEEESGGVAEDYRANGIPWKRSRDREKTDGAGKPVEWRVIKLRPGENAPECRIPADHPEWEQELVKRELGFDLVRHAGLNELDRMAEDIAAGADINFLPAGGQTPFMAAVRGGHLEAAKLLVAHGADPDKRYKVSCTALNEAARFGRMDVIRYLVEALELPVNQQDYYGSTPLSCAVGNLYPEAVAYFLEHGADVDLPTKEGRTPLMDIAGADISEGAAHTIAELLLDHGADVNRRDRKGRTALFYALWTKHWKARLERLRTAGADFMVCDKKGTSALLHVARMKYDKSWRGFVVPLLESNEDRETMALALYLMRQGINPNLPDKNGVVPAMTVTGDFLKLLLKSGANPSATDVLGRSVAMYHANSPDDLLLLQQYGADMLAKDLRGDDVLLLAEISSVIVFIIETFGFPIDDQNEEGISILLRACTKGLPGLVEYLIQHGANPSIRTKNGKTPLDILDEQYININDRRHDHRKIFDFLKDRLSGQSPPPAPEELPAEKSQHRSDQNNPRRNEMKKVRITVKKIVRHDDLIAQYENPIEHTCDMKLGQVFVCNGWERPEGFCSSAWDTVSAFVMTLAHGGENFYDGWMKNPKSAMISCNDGFRPVSFLLETMDEDAES